MLLHILSELFLVCFLEFIDYIVILPIVIELFLELFDTLLELLLRVHYLEPHLRDLILVLLLDHPLAVFHLGPVLLELLLRLLPLGGVPLLDVPDHRLHVRLLPRLLQGVPLPRHHSVRLSQDRLYLFFVGACQRGLELTVFFIF
jgi:hypothetical protein